MHRDFRKPLIVFSPKKLLRYPECVSPIEDFTKGSFQEVIDDPKADPKKVDTVMFLHGKIYYEILEKKSVYGDFENIALVRLEQINPIPLDQIKAVLKKYSNAKKHYWVQEEPENQGAWSFLLRKFREVHLDVISRHETSSPATGSHKRHEARSKILFDKIFACAKLIKVKATA